MDALTLRSSRGSQEHVGAVSELHVLHVVPGPGMRTSPKVPPRQDRPELGERPAVWSSTFAATSDAEPGRRVAAAPRRCHEW